MSEFAPASGAGCVPAHARGAIAGRSRLLSAGPSGTSFKPSLCSPVAPSGLWSSCANGGGGIRAPFGAAMLGLGGGAAFPFVPQNDQCLPGKGGGQGCGGGGRGGGGPAITQ